MKRERRIDEFVERINGVVNYFRYEYKMTYAEAVGALEIVKFDLLQEMLDDEDW